MTDTTPLPWQDALLATQLRLIAHGAAETTGSGVVIQVADERGRLYLVAREDQPSDRPSDRPGDRPGDRPSDRPDDRSGDRPSDRPDQTGAAARRHRLTDDGGRLVGVLDVTPPANARPVLDRQNDVRRHADRARDAILLALERHRAAEEVRQARTVRDLLRSAMAQLSEGVDLETALGRVADQMVEHFRLAGLWFMIVGENQVRLPDVRRGHVPDRAAVPPVPEIIDRLWARGQVSLLGRDERINLEGVDEALLADSLRFLDEAGYASMMSTPLSTRTGSLGSVRAWRALDGPRWTDLELETIGELAQELGQVFDSALADQHDRELVADLRALNTYKSDMVATVSHELKNPLTTLATNVEMLEDPTLSADERRRALGAIERSTQRMTRIVDDLQLLGARRGAEQRPLDLVALVRGVCEAAADATTLRGQHLVVRTPGAPLVVSGDAVDLDRMTMNLVSNATKYSPTGTTIRVTVHRDGDEAVLAVADEGIGISAEDQQQIFTEFFRGTDPHTLAEPGTGLGLAIARRVAERHRGSIEVESEPGAGSTFRVRLPLGPDDGTAR